MILCEFEYVWYNFFLVRCFCFTDEVCTLIVTEFNCFVVAEMRTTHGAREWFDSTVEEMKALLYIYTDSIRYSKASLP